MDIESPMPPRNRYQSFRMACDRCRLHKLKCLPGANVNTPFQTCQRCHRAKNGCTYSLRARTGRPPEEKILAKAAVMATTTVENGLAGKLSTSPCTSGSKSEKHLKKATETVSQFQYDSRMDEVALIDWDEGYDTQADLVMIPYSFADIPDWYCLQNAERASIPSCSQLSSNSNCNISASHVNLLPSYSDEENRDYDLLFQNDQDETRTNSDRLNSCMESSKVDKMRWNVSQSMDYDGIEITSSEPFDISPTSTSRGVESSNGVSPHLISQFGNQLDEVGAFEMLTKLAAQLHKQQALLKQISPLNPKEQIKESIPLKEYPVENILNLSTELTRALASMFSANKKQNLGSEQSNITFGISLEQASERKEAKQAPSLSNVPSSRSAVDDSSRCHEIDTPTALLVLSCYVSFRSICSLTCMYFSHYLSLLPPTHHSNYADHLQPGEWFGNLCTRIYTSFRRLLEVLEAIEDILLLPSHFRAVQRSSVPDKHTGSSNDVSSPGEVEKDVESSPITEDCRVSLSLVDAVLNREVDVDYMDDDDDDDEGGLNQVCKNIDGLRKALRYRMDL